MVLIIAAVVAIVVVAGVVVWLARPSSKHDTASKGSSGAITTSASRPSSSAPSTGGSAPTSSGVTSPIIPPPLGPAQNFPVSAAAAWTDTALMVTKGERINIVATGTIVPGPGLSCGPDGLSTAGLDVFSIIGGGHVAALIGLVGGSDEPFLIGSNFDGVAPATGRFYLGINDTGVNNNSGRFTTVVRLQQS